MRISDWSSDVCSSDLIVFTATVSGASANGSPEPAVANYQETRTRFIVANGTRYAYRRFGNESGVPLVLFAHFRASMDNWDPQLLNRLAERRTIIAFNNKGVSSSSGQTPDTIEAMADDAETFVAIGRAAGRERVCQYV